MQKGQSAKHVHHTPSCTTNTDLVRSFTMAGLASDDALRGERYCGYSGIQTIDSEFLGVASLQSEPHEGKLRYWGSPA